MRRLLLVLLLAAVVAVPAASSRTLQHSVAKSRNAGTAALPALPSRWPRTLQIGLTDSPGGAAALRRSAPFGFRLLYGQTFVRLAGVRLVAWQIPLGNTVMRAMNDTWGHYQDNRVQWLLGEQGRAHLRAYVHAGYVGFLFGGGADGTTCACDARHDGVTDPPPIAGNTRPSLSADDDGGYFRGRVRAYYRAGALTLPG